MPGAVFNQATLALEAALAGQGVALACRAFVATDLEAGHLVQVSDATMTKAPSYFLVRKPSSLPLDARDAVCAVWDWCMTRLSFNAD